MLLKINHQTEYHYDNPRGRILQSHRLYPSSSSAQKVLSWEVSCNDASFGSYFYDGAGDRIRTMCVISPVSNITISVVGEINTLDTSGVVRLDRDMISPLVYMRSSPATLPSAALLDAAQQATAGLEKSLDKAHALTSYISEAIEYIPDTTDSTYTADQALRQGRGVCQDQTHCLISMARIIGIPARYVAGYIFTDADGEQHNASHAWAELYIDDLGWVGFDATNACCSDDRYVRIGSGVDAQNAALIRGVSHGHGTETMKISVKIVGMQQ